MTLFAIRRALLEIMGKKQQQQQPRSPELFNCRHTRQKDSNNVNKGRRNRNFFPGRLTVMRRKHMLCTILICHRVRDQINLEANEACKSVLPVCPIVIHGNDKNERFNLYAGKLASFLAQMTLCHETHYQLRSFKIRRAPPHSY
jgi:hypothetical protein